MNVLFVCTGNTCRSPMAEHLFRKMLKEAERTDVEVVSAGVSPSPWLGFPAEAQEALKQEGVTQVRHKAQGLTHRLVDGADLILAMEAHHKKSVLQEFPEAASKTYVLNTYAGLGQDSAGIRDPYGHPLPVYVKVLSEIKLALQKILMKI